MLVFSVFYLLFLPKEIVHCLAEREALPKEIVHCLAEREAKFISKLMDTREKREKNRNQRSIWAESELGGGGHFTESTL